MSSFVFHQFNEKLGVDNLSDFTDGSSLEIDDIENEIKVLIPEIAKIEIAFCGDMLINGHTDDSDVYIKNIQ